MTSELGLRLGEEEEKKKNKNFIYTYTKKDFYDKNKQERNKGIKL